jgi:2-hydroxychromene-2-carboxylate isomerase
MNTEKKQAVKKQRTAWVQGQSVAVPERLTAYERELIRLGLEGASIEQLVASEELRAFAARVRNERYLPWDFIAPLGSTYSLEPWRAL